MEAADGGQIADICFDELSAEITQLARTILQIDAKASFPFTQI